jgi:ABC-type sugar transport system ATPase subunit
MAQIAAALGAKTRVIIMDEPTSSLSAGESERLFGLMAELKRRGITVIYVTHRMEEIFRLCDTLTVLRDGRHVATEPAAASSPGRVIRQMVGRELVFPVQRHLERDLGPAVLRVEGLSSPGKFKNVGFELRAGEILGMAGLVGAGRSEVTQAIFGLDPEATGRIWVEGREPRPRSVKAALAAGLGLLPEDRKRQGLVLGMNCRENSSLAALERFSTAGFVRRGDERRAVEVYSERLRVKTPSLEARADGLSGGNQQKLALAKWLIRECKVLIVDEPTRGVDVGAKAEIHRLLDELACQGLAILLISSELPEVMNLSRRIIVLREGSQVGVVERGEFSEEALMRRMAGIAHHAE